MQPSTDLLLTGVPRSGTSLLTALINRVPDHAAVNEPQLSRRSWLADPLAAVTELHTSLRSTLSRGLPVPNKPTTDTYLRGETVSWRPPQPLGDTFVLATKWTLRYLGALERLAPHMRIVALVRHPADTIAAWQRSFRHLRDPYPRGLWAAHLSPDRRQALRDLLRAPDIHRHARLWALLVDQLLDSAPSATVLRYEDLCADPRKQVAKATARPVDSLPEEFGNGVHAPRGHRYSRAELEIVAEHCGPLARRLGYDISAG